MKKKIKQPKKVKAEKVFIYWSFVPEWWSRMIVRITGRQLPDKSDAWSHMGIAFELSDGTIQAYEALFEKGFHGPEPLVDIKKKIKQKQGAMVVEQIVKSRLFANRIYIECKRWVGEKGYHKWQLASMWFFERIGRWIGWKIPRSPDRLVCSEAVARLVYPHLDLRDEIRTGFDEVNPNSGWRKFLKLKNDKKKGVKK